MTLFFLKGLHAALSAETGLLDSTTVSSPVRDAKDSLGMDE